MKELVVIIGFVALCVLLVATAGQPVPVGVVTSESMSPVLEPGDVYLSLPSTSLIEPSVGDIVVFHGFDGWTVHRIVETTDSGFLTAGDGNPFLDQQQDEPPIPESAITGIVPTVGSTPLAVPYLGSLDTRLRLLILGLGGILVVMGLPTSETATPTPWLVPVLVGGVVILSWYVGAPADGGDAVSAIGNDGYIPHVVIQPDGATDPRVLWPGATIDVPDDGIPRTVIGWAPAWLLSLTSSIDDRLTVVLIAGVSATISGVVAVAVHRLTLPEVSR